MFFLSEATFLFLLGCCRLVCVTVSSISIHQTTVDLFSSLLFSTSECVSVWVCDEDGGNGTHNSISWSWPSVPFTRVHCFIEFNSIDWNHLESSSHLAIVPFGWFVFCLEFFAYVRHVDHDSSSSSSSRETWRICADRENSCPITGEQFITVNNSCFNVLTVSLFSYNDMLS